MRHLVVFRHPPYAGIRALETLDLLLTLAAFDQVVDVLLIDDGVWQLVSDQQPKILGQRNLVALWQGLEMYGIGTPWVEEESLCLRELRVDDLLIPVRLLPRRQVAAFWGKYDRILGD